LAGPDAATAPVAVADAVPGAVAPLRTGRRAAVLRAGSGTLLGNGAGAVLPFLVTAWLGTGRDTDVFFLVTGVVTTVATVFAVVLERGVVPFAAGPAGAPGALHGLVRAIGRQAALAAGLAGAAASAVLVAAVGPATAPGELALRLAVVLLPLPALAAASAAAAGGLYARGVYLMPAASVALRAGGGLVAGLVAGPALGVPAVAAGLVLGEAARALLLDRALRAGPGSRVADGTRPAGGRVRRPSPGPARPSTAAFWRTVGPHTLSMGLVVTTPLVDKAVAAPLGAGAVTVVELCDKLFYAPLVLVGAGIAVVSGTAWAEAVERGGPTDALRRDYARSQAGVAAAATVVALLGAGALWLAEPLVRRLLAIPPDLPFASTLTLFLAGLPFAVVGDLGVRLVVAFRRTWLMVGSAVLIVTVNLAGDLIGAALLGLDGIALASTVARAANAAFVLVVTWRLLRGRPA